MASPDKNVKQPAVGDNDHIVVDVPIPIEETIGKPPRRHQALTGPAFLITFEHIHCSSRSRHNHITIQRHPASQQFFIGYGQLGRFHPIAIRLSEHIHRARRPHRQHTAIQRQRTAEPPVTGYGQLGRFHPIAIRLSEHIHRARRPHRQHTAIQRQRTAEPILQRPVRRHQSMTEHCSTRA